MPRTRNERCKRILHDYFNEKLGNLYYDLTKLDTNGWKVARYTLKIPAQWNDWILNHNNETNILTWDENIKYQNILSNEKMNEIYHQFKTMFEPYEKKTGSTSISYLRIHDFVTSENENTFHLIIVYDKEYLPFPEDINLQQRCDYLERQNQNLSNTLINFRSETDAYVRRTRRKYQTLVAECTRLQNSLAQCSQLFEERSATQLGQYRKIIQKMYLEMNKEFECPVCYERIENDNVFTTPCQHVICNECTKHCKNVCPMCRQSMAFTPSDAELAIFTLNDV